MLVFKRQTSYSTLIGYNVGCTIGSIGSNNIIIGTNISLSAGTTNSINLGGVLF
jgi:sRNA-binding carbon storage regulator CsrA